MFQSFDYRKTIISPKFVWLNGKFSCNQQLKIGENGEIIEIGEKLDKNDFNFIELIDSAIVPGFVNSHSHAFHRYLRGQTGIGQSETDSFWKWRDAMYALVQNIEYDQFKQLCKGTFEEMLSAGITTVGEFHYVHHGSERFDLDTAVLEAAEEVGIRLVLIETLYIRSGFGSTTVETKQARFGTNFEEFIENLEKLEKICSKKSTLAVAAHSTRAVDPESIQELWNYARKHNKAFHIHLEEQPKEIEDCMNSVHHLCPSELLLDKVVPPRQNLTAVHCTYTQRPELNELNKSGAKICICPLTEGFLGDGIPRINENDQICLGTDCNNRISFLEEMRWLTYCQNMKHNTRNAAGLNSKKLLQIATMNGAESLLLQNSVGQFKPGYQLDFVAFNIKNEKLEKFATEDQLLDAIIFGCGNQEIQAVGVGGVGRFY